MRSEDVLAAVRTGLWQWDSATGSATLDSTAAHLLGVPSAPGRSGILTMSAATFRSRVHVVDYVELQGIIDLALEEGTLAEALLRIVSPEGTVLRTVRVKLRAEQPRGEPVRPDRPLDPEHPVHPERSLRPEHVRGPERHGDVRMVGVVSEVPEPSAAQTPVTGDWRRSREAFLLDAGRALAEAYSTSEVLRVAASLSMPGFSPDGQAVFGVDGGRLHVIGHHGQQPSEENPFNGMPLETDYPACECIRTGRAVYLARPEDYRSRYPGTWPLAERFGRNSWAFLPLNVAGRTIGSWMAAFSHPVSFTPDERSVLTTVARMLAQALSRTTQHETERELSAGLQRTMRPVHKPDIVGMALAARYVPTGGGLQVGGDWYDVIPLPSGRTALVIGDVQGHDVRAAGVMSQLRIALRAYASEGHHPDSVLSRASRFLAGLDTTTEDAWSGAGTGTGRDGLGPETRFATCLYMEVDPLTGIIDIARAGHPDPAIRMVDGTVLVRPTAGGLPLGVEPDTEYPTTRLILEPGETLLACTDGLLETGGHDLDTGWQRVRAIFGEHRDEAFPDGDLEALADDILQAVHGPPSHHTTGPLHERRDDDIALLLLAHADRCAVVPGRPGRPGSAEGRTSRRTVLAVGQSEPDRVADARHQLQSLLFDWSSEDQVDGAVLMLSEMLTNVLVHTDGDALLVAEISGPHGERKLRVEVADRSDELPHRRQPGELASSGRGLVLMEMLAGSWGVDPRGEGKSIWFEVREDEPAPQWG
ncbi:SpoIIE family protein phosphatase [Streptomyces sp. HNM0574]|uniref:ATP-binding SpoIIE family protein phosphatase n=1 Tax=Streptomyces sp. HNM0574 TaxID=2714954 RepID=UPI00146A81A5|nr:SpoIIE family protein phosphatase [Streptomyces sp. HNM0574]NLU69568.1 SpoIIE family protein phosphatase [Streptomyces sp. HNM0574]